MNKAEFAALRGDMTDFVAWMRSPVSRDGALNAAHLQHTLGVVLELVTALTSATTTLRKLYHLNDGPPDARPIGRWARWRRTWRRWFHSRHARRLLSELGVVVQQLQQARLASLASGRSAPHVEDLRAFPALVDELNRKTDELAQMLWRH